MPRFVIVGTGRCGTTFTSRLLIRSGVKCGHETVFRSSGVWPKFGYEGDSSWFTVPHLDDFRGLVLHQVRDPLATVSSLASREMWSEDSALRGFIEPYVALGDDPLRNAMRFYCTWNAMCERSAILRFRIEDIDRELPAIMAVVAPDRLEAASNVLREMRRDVNARARRYSMERFDELPDGDDREHLIETAARYGYIQA